MPLAPVTGAANIYATQGEAGGLQAATVVDRFAGEILAWVVGRQAR
jgi:hypothetical protein